MKQLVLVTALFVAVSTSLFAGEEQKRHIPLIGVVRIQSVFKDYKYAQDMEKSIRTEFEKDETEIKDLEKQMRQKRDELRNDPLIKPGGTRFKLGMIEIERLKVLRDDKLSGFKKETAKRMAEFYRTIYDDFRKAVKRYATHYSYDLIITAPKPELAEVGEEVDNANPQAIQNEILLRRVQFIGKSVDITAPIIELMNRFYTQKKAAATPK